MKTILCILPAFIALFLMTGGCQEQEFPIQSLRTGQVSRTIGDTVYVAQNPDWTGFNHPQDIIVGNEPFVYVADTYNNRIVMLDLGGRLLGYSQTIKNPVAIAEDKRLQLIVCAEFDTLLAGHSQPTTFGAIYRLDLFATGNVISAAVPRRVFYDPTDSVRRYTGVAALSDNTYYVTRIGPKNELARIDKDIAVLLFSKSDQLITPIANLTPEGTGLRSLHDLTSIATFPTGRSVEFVISQTGVNALFKVQWIRLVPAGQTTYFDSKFYPSVDGEIGLLQLGKFDQPEDVALDPSGNLFVVDAGKDSLYRFSTRGIERYSFGGTGSGERQFRQPWGVAFHDKTVYVADAGNNRIVRFKLSTDLD